MPSIKFHGDLSRQYAHVTRCIERAVASDFLSILYRLDWNIVLYCLRTPVSSRFMHLFVPKPVIPGSFYGVRVPRGGRLSIAAPHFVKPASSCFHSRCTDLIFGDTRFTVQGGTASPLISFCPCSIRGEIT